MTYSLLAAIARWEVVLFVGGLIATIAIGLLTGKINTRYLFYGIRADGSRYFSIERVQLLVATIAVAYQYFLNAAQTKTGSMPDLPAGSLELLGLSNAIYLGGKAVAAFRKTTSGGGAS